MSRTILEIAQEAAERDATAPAPDVLFGTNNRIARILRTAAHDVMRDYLRRTGWQGASDLHSTWVFALQKGKYAYALPPDYLQSIPQTEQRDGWAMGLVGPATPQQWSLWLTGMGAVAAPHGWRIKNGALFIEPTPQSSELVTIEYVSSYPVISEVKAGDFNLNGALPVANAPFVPQEGHLVSMDPAIIMGKDDGDDARYADAENGYDVGHWPDDPLEVLKRIHPFSAQAPLPQVRRPAFDADTDRPAFRDDHVLSLGMTFHLQRAMGIAYAERAAEYEHEVEVRAATDAGGPRDFQLGSPGRGADVWPIGHGKWLLS